jgi:hypothetical protein
VEPAAVLEAAVLEAAESVAESEALVTTSFWALSVVSL